MPDDELAELAIKDLFGELHTVESIEPSEDPNIRWGRGTFAFKTQGEARTFESRAKQLAFKGLGAGPAYEKSSQKTVAIMRCVEEARYRGKFDDAAESACKRENYLEHINDLGWNTYDRLLMGIYLQGLLEVAGGRVDAPAMYDKFVDTFGYEIVRYKFHTSEPSNNDWWSIKLEPIPLEKWGRRQVAYAIDYAGRHGVDATKVATLKKALAKAPRHRCRLVQFAFFQAHQGGGKYGEVTPRMGGRLYGEEVDCKQARKMKNAKWAVKEATDHAKKHNIDVEKFLAIEPKGDWQVVKDDMGRIVEKRLDVEAVIQEGL